jgi:hypothetical protein
MACCHQIHVKAFGGLTAATRRRLRAIAEGARTGKAMPIPAPLRIEPDTWVVRARRGRPGTTRHRALGYHPVRNRPIRESRATHRPPVAMHQRMKIGR